MNRSIPLKNSKRGPVIEIMVIKDGIVPGHLGNIHLKQHGLTNIEEMTVLANQKSILLWSVSTQYLEKNTIGFKETLKLEGCFIFGRIATPQYLNGFIKLIPNFSIERTKNAINFKM